MISRRSLASALGSRKVADWTIVERSQEVATVSDEADRPLRRSELRTRFTLLVHHDVPRGRGSVRLDLATRQGDARDIVDQAISLASAAIGPPWTSLPAAAPAKVTLVDDTLAKMDLEALAAELVASAKRPAGSAVQLGVEIVRERVTVQSESGFHTDWLATNLAAQGLISVGDHSLEIAREARRRTELETELRDALDAAALDLAQLAAAGAPVGGRCAVILRADALLHGGGLGMWRVFADHATAESERQGLTRYRQGMPIAPGADQVPEPLSITSNGALDYGARSAPVDDDGSAVRRFSLIEHGVAAGLGLSAREAARRKVEPNGGVRNLVVSRGTWAGALPASGRTIDVHRLRSLSIDPYTGDASLELGLSLDRGTPDRPFAGGTVRLDLVAALARARRSATAVHRGAYIGPAAVLIEDAELLA